MPANKFRVDVQEVQDELQRVEAALSMRRYDLAIELLQKLLRLHPENAAVFYTLSRAYLCKKDWSAASKAVREALLLDPDYNQAHTLYGNILSGLKNIAAAEQEYRRSLGLFSLDAYTHYVYALLLIEKAKGVMRMEVDKQRDLFQAQEHASEALRLDPAVAMHHATMGEILGLQGRFEEAEAEFQQALSLEPERASVFSVYGWYLLEKRNQPEQAFEYLRHALHLDPNDARTRQLFFVTLKTKNKWYHMFWQTHFLFRTCGQIEPSLLILACVALLMVQEAWSTNLLFQVVRDLFIILLMGLLTCVFMVEALLIVLLRREKS
jgi:Tfp pilus assembly protein PilF